MRRAVAVLCAALIVVACRKPEGHDHASEHAEGHDHHKAGHGHHEPVVRATLWSEGHEIFAEHAPAFVGQKVALLVHVTELDGFRAVEAGPVRLELSGPESLHAESAKAKRPGIFELAVTPKKAGSYRGSFVIGNGGVVGGVELKVAADEAAASAATPKEAHEGLIELLKEQQWGVPFGTAFAERATIVASIEVAGSVTTPPGGSAEVGAPAAGRVVAPARGLPRPGERVRKGQLLASFAPAPASPEEAARAGLAVAEAEARAAKAATALERAERLIVDQAIAQKELEDARREAGLAREAVRAAKAARQVFSGAAAGSGGGSWRLKSPIDGVLVDVLATPGAAVAQGALLFRLVDPRELWIRARVPEQDAARLRTDRDASFRITGLDDFLPLRVTGEDAGAALVSVGRTVDEKTRTVDVTYTLKQPDPRLRVGGLVRVSLPAGPDFDGVVVPRTAVVDRDGREVVYVQVDGEHFEERAVRTGPRQGVRIGVTEGLKARERVVVRGTHVVRLAAGAGSAPAHGHVH